MLRRWLIALTLLSLVWTSLPRASDTLEILFFDVGQGDSALVRFPGGRAWLVDGGGSWRSPNFGSRVLVPELLSLGLTELDVLLLTHPDADHGVGFSGIFDRLRAHELWLARFPKLKESSLTLLKTLRGKAVRNRVIWRELTQDRTGVVDGVGYRVITPSSMSRGTNDRSLLLQLSYGRCQILFTGDVEREGERAVISKLGDRIDLLKVAHHGSRTSSTPEFLKAARPRWSVISVGKNNRYGHPANSVIQRLKENNGAIFRTDFHGFVQFSIRASGDVRCRSSKGDCGIGWCD